MVNYVICVITGCLFAGQFPFQAVVFQKPWFPWSLLMGVGFVLIFSLLAFCTRIDGITTTIIANKLSLVIPVLFAICLFSEHIGILKGTGIVLAFPAVYLTTRVKETNGKPQGLFWPTLLFIGSGLLDTGMNYIQHTLLSKGEDEAIFAVFCFATAGVAGATWLLLLLLYGKTRFRARNVVAGICLGVPNYFSIYYLIRTLNSNVMQSSATIPVLNMGIVVASALTAFLLFREKMNQLRIIGLLLSVAAILFIASGDR